MKKIIVLVGASGSGKTTLAFALAECRPDEFDVVQKKSDRYLRPDDKDIVSAPLPFTGTDQHLMYLNNGGNRYAVDVVELREKLAYKHQLLIVNQHQAIRFLKLLFPGAVQVVFIHRHMLKMDLYNVIRDRGEGSIGGNLDQRWMKRELLYEQLASGVLPVDAVVLNHTIENAAQQLARVAEREMQAPPKTSTHAPVLHIVLAGTGSVKDKLFGMVKTIPGGAQFVIPKYVTRPRRAEDSNETINVERIPEGCLQYNFFGMSYGVDAEAIWQQLNRYCIGFVTISDIATALRLRELVEARGGRVRLMYLHQPLQDMKGYSPEESQLRQQHSASLVELYEQELVSASRVDVILPETKDAFCAWIQWLILEALEGRKM